MPNPDAQPDNHAKVIAKLQEILDYLVKIYEIIGKEKK